jgi:hypothetical protein
LSVEAGMTKHFAVYGVILFLAFAIAIPSACTKPFRLETPSFDKLISDGKAFLTINEGVEATTAFSLARADRPDSSDANFGLLLAHPMKFINLLDDISGLASAFLYTPPPTGAAGDWRLLRQSQDLPIGDYLQDYFGVAIEAEFLESEEIFAAMRREGDFDFQLESYPVVFGGQKLLAFSGEFDKTDLYLFAAVNSLVLSFLDVLQAYDLNFDVWSLTLPTLDFFGDPEGAIMAIVDLIDGLLNDPDYPDFLLVKGPEGFARLNRAGIDLGNIFARSALAFDQLARETDEQTDDQFRYVDANANGEFDQQIDPVQIGELLTLDPGLAPIVQQILVDLSYAFWEGSLRDPHPGETDTINLSMLNDLLIFFDLIQNPVLPEGIGIDVGSFFSHPTRDGLRSMVVALVEFLESVYGTDSAD